MNRPRPYYVVMNFRRAQVDIPVGVILVDPTHGLLVRRFRERWDFVEDDDREVLVALSADIEQWAREQGPEAVIAYLEDMASNALYVSDRHYLDLDTDLPMALKDIFAREIAS